MRLGALLGPVTDAGQPKFIAEQARMYAAEGYTSLWCAQAIGRGFMMPDPLLALTAAAAVTQHVELGTAVLQLPLYHPMDLAHRVFTLQQMCSAGLSLGVGAGSSVADFEALARPYALRFREFDAALAALRGIFTSGGLADSQLSPWPVLGAGPPLLFGTWGHGVQRAAAEFSGWIASGHYRTTEEVCASLGVYRAAGGGRALVSTLQIGADTDQGAFRVRLERFADAGFDDAVIMRLPGAPSAAEIRKWVR